MTIDEIDVEMQALRGRTDSDARKRRGELSRMRAKAIGIKKGDKVKRKKPKHCKHRIAERPDLPHKGPCCVPVECSVAGIVLSSQCGPGKCIQYAPR